MGTLSEKRLFLLDMDGTLYLGDRLYPFTIELLQAIKNNGGKWGVLGKINENEVVLKKRAEFGCKKCDIF